MTTNPQHIMQTRILHLFTRTPLHVGAGSSVGYIDQPVMRERHTRFPIIPGSSLKGVLADLFLEPGPEKDGKPGKLQRTADGRLIFGHEDSTATDAASGSVSFGEARLLLFPVRSAKGAFVLATSPLALERYNRDAKLGLEIPKLPSDMHCLAGAQSVISNKDQRGVVLEEYRFDVDGEFPKAWEEVLTKLLDDSVLKNSAGRFVLLSDGDLSHFAEHACQVQQHVRIDDETGTAEDGGLFNEETVPSETLLYSVLTELARRKDALKTLGEKLDGEALLQFGGSGTTGLGYCTVSLGKPLTK